VGSLHSGDAVPTAFVHYALQKGGVMSMGHSTGHDEQGNLLAGGRG
jgi:hypothetical protein